MYNVTTTLLKIITKPQPAPEVSIRAWDEIQAGRKVAKELDMIIRHPVESNAPANPNDGIIVAYTNESTRSKEPLQSRYILSLDALIELCMGVEEKELIEVPGR